MVYCRSCSLSSEYIPGRGYNGSGICFISLFPLVDDDRRILDIALELSGVNPCNVWITSLLKCADNFDKNIDIDNCILNCSKKYLEPDIIAGNPKVIVAMNYHVIKYFIGGIYTIGKLYNPIERSFSVVTALCPVLIKLKKCDKILVDKWCDSFKLALKALSIYKKYQK